MDDLDSVIINLRACLVSIKGGIPLNQLENDYFKLNGEQIPFKNLGFSSLEALLLSSGKFIIKNHGGNKIVQVLPTNKTQHLTDLIKKQKSKPHKKKSFVGSNVVSPKYNILNSYNISNNYSRQETNGSENNMNYNKHGIQIENLDQIKMPMINNDINDNIAYGKYVTKRLNNIKDVTVQDDIKLEIDHIFYKKIKLMLNNTK